MTPFGQAIEAHQRGRGPRSFEEDLVLHLQHGFVFSTPDFFIMGRAVVRTAAPEWILDPANPFAREDCDTWLVYLAAGDLGKAWSILPWPLPWLAFERNNDLRFYELARIRRLSTTPDHEESPPTDQV
jgi:hypothetical protein